MSLHHSPKIITNGLVLCLDAANRKSYTGSGATWRDLTPNNNTCSLQSSPTFENEFGGSIKFVPNQYAIVSHSSSILPSSSMTWQIAIKYNSFPTYSCIFNKGDEFNSTGFIALFNTNNILRLEASDVSYSTRFVDSGANWSTTLSTGIYYILHLTYDGSNFRMYYNGALRHTTVWSFGLGTNQEQLWLGRFWAGYLNGNLAHFSIFNKVLTANEIYQNANVLKRRFRL